MRLHGQVLARAEGAANAGHREPDLLGRQSEDVRELLLVDVQPLGRDVEVDSTFGIRNREPGFRSERRLVLHADLVLATDHDIGPRHLVAVPDLHVARHIPVRVKPRCFRPERVLGLRHRTQDLVFDAHLLRGTSCLLGMVGRDQRDRLAPVADKVEREHRLILDLEAIELHAWHVLVSEHRVNAGHRTRFRCVDRRDPRVGMRAAHRRAPQHVFGMKVGRIGECAADLGWAVDPLDAFADPHRAAMFTASMIFA